MFMSDVATACCLLVLARGLACTKMSAASAPTGAVALDGSLPPEQLVSMILGPS